MKTGTLTGTFSEKLLNENEVKVILYDSPELAFDAINEGKLEAFVYDKAILDYMSSKDKYSNIIVNDNTFNNQTYGFAINKENDTLIDVINPTILKLINSDRWESLLSKYKID